MRRGGGVKRLEREDKRRRYTRCFRTVMTERLSTSATLSAIPRYFLARSGIVMTQSKIYFSVTYSWHPVAGLSPPPLTGVSSETVFKSPNDSALFSRILLKRSARRLNQTIRYRNADFTFAYVSVHVIYRYLLNPYDNCVLLLSRYSRNRGAIQGVGIPKRPPREKATS